MLWPYILRHNLTVVGLVIVLLVGAVTLLGVPLLLGEAFDAFLAGALESGLPLSELNDKFFLLFVVVLVLGLIGALRVYLASRLGERVAADVRIDLYTHMLSLSPLFHSNMRSGDAVSRLTADTTLIEIFLGSWAALALRTMLNTLGALVMMFVVSWQLGGLLLLVLPLMIAPPLLLGRTIRTMSARAQAKLAEAGAESAEALDMIELVQAYGQEASWRNMFGASVEATFKSAMSRNLARAGMMILVSVVFAVGIVGIVWWGTQLVAENTISGGQLASMILYTLLAGLGVAVLAQMYGETMRTVGALDRAAEVFSAGSRIKAPANPVTLPSRPRGELCFDKVTFAYDEGSAPVLSDFELKIAPGEFVALVGPSGAGKSTVFRLALRLYDVQQGTISLDGISAASVCPNDWRAKFAYAPQNSTLITGSARENIAFGNAQADDQQIMLAAQHAEAWEFLRDKDGLDTLLGEKGRALSGGQRQRIALARSLVRDASILLFDEVTSVLDAESELYVQRAIERASRGRTTLAIAHRFRLIRNADRIIVMDKGRIVESGTHRELVSGGGLYARLADQQFTD